MIDENLLKKYGATHKKLQKGEMLFSEGDEAFFYYQILSGKVKMNNYNDNGKETIQGIFGAGKSFGEPAILGDFVFPANGEGVEDAVLIRLEKSRFFQLLQENPEVSIGLLKVLSHRLRFKAIMAKEVKGHEAEHRIMTLLKYLKKNSETDGEYCVDITRQTIANMTGLRVETVIRAIKNLKDKEMLQVKNRKLFL